MLPESELIVCGPWQLSGSAVPQRKFFPKFGIQLPMAQRAAEGKISFLNGGRIGHHAHHVRRNLELCLHGFKQLPGFSSSISCFNWSRSRHQPLLLVRAHIVSDCLGVTGIFGGSTVRSPSFPGFQFLVRYRGSFTPKTSTRSISGGLENNSAALAMRALAIGPLR